MHVFPLLTQFRWILLGNLLLTFQMAVFVLQDVGMPFH